MLSVALWSYGQSRTVTGTVTDDKNELLPGATIMVKGTSTVTSTNIKGAYSINVSDENAILVVSFVGFDNLEVKVGKQSVHNIQLLQQSKTLSDVVVTGYQTQKKADLTGAVSVVDVKELKKMPNNNPIQALQGRVPGMLIYTDGSPSGSNVNILIRGISSINGTNPLYVIDGVATTAGMHELNPNDIESIQVLKDASSASIYGSRAASGVIIITTKKAKKGELQVNANARRSYSFYESKLNVLDAEGYGKAAWQASANDAIAYGGSPLSSYLIYQFDWKQNANGTYSLNKINIPEYIDPAKTMKTANTDWFKEISQTGISQNYDLSVAHGTDKGSSVFSMDYTDNQGIVKTTDFKRISARMNTDYKLINDKLLIGENFTASTTQEVQGNTLNAALQALPVIPVHTVDGIGWGGPYGGMNDRQNPVRLLEDNKQNHYNYLRLFGNAFADLEVINGLHLRSSLGIDYGNYTMRNMQLAYVSGYLNNPINQVTMTNSNTTKLTWTNTLDYKRIIGKHSIDVLGGFEAYKENNLDFSASRQGFASEDPNYMYLNAGTGLKDNGGGASEYRLLSYFGKVNYVYNEKYLASATVRYDGSSRFGTNNQFGLFPAFSVGWRINNEDFIKNNVRFISDLKLRYGYGKNGNQDNIPATASKTLYATNYNGTSYNFSGSGSGNLPSGYQIIQRSNDDVKWETTTQSNLGLDFGFLEQKVFGSVDVFVKKTSDMLITPAYIAVIGEGGNRTVNGASLENRGFEFLIGYRGRIASKVDFEVTGNIATYRNKFTSLPAEVVNSYGGNGTGDNILGHAVGSGYGYVADGLFTTTDQVLTSADQLGKGLGRIRYKDLNGDGVINEKDQAWIFNPTPDYTYGVNFNFSYKGFDLTMFFQGVGNQQINVQDIKSATDFWSVSETGSNKGTRLLNAWSVSNPNSTIPALTLTDRNNESRFSTYYIENGRYLKLRNLQIGYSLPKNLLSKIKASNFNVYVSGQNLFTIKSKSFSGVDPEIPSYGYPIPTMITTGIKVAF
ncbi:TonB-linked SusC/RagA family outer membrane protein [Mucilaginibacter gracilis]|uniref:TonB-linked SusC/RagA family outer membrane protein n=2 Tax=Mucilaginibacter gracilis TaxID=423350 RepID=A0A495IUJ0_9SPHI|nr:TonB-linked SusC/RagA family outer membrane protein [Mucilaginibacter gracilis]